jgi:hypothetical protein
MTTLWPRRQSRTTACSAARRSPSGTPRAGPSAVSSSCFPRRSSCSAVRAATAASRRWIPWVASGSAPASAAGRAAWRPRDASDSDGGSGQARSPRPAAQSEAPVPARNCRAGEKDGGGGGGDQMSSGPWSAPSLRASPPPTSPRFTTPVARSVTSPPRPPSPLSDPAGSAGASGGDRKQKNVKKKKEAPACEGINRIQSASVHGVKRQNKTTKIKQTHKKNTPPSHAPPDLGREEELISIILRRASSICGFRGSNAGLELAAGVRSADGEGGTAPAALPAAGAVSVDSPRSYAAIIRAATDSHGSVGGADRGGVG